VLCAEALAIHLQWQQPQVKLVVEGCRSWGLWRLALLLIFGTGSDAFLLWFRLVKSMPGCRMLRFGCGGHVHSCIGIYSVLVSINAVVVQGICGM